MNVTVVITVDQAGHMTIDATGPIRPDGGLVTLLQEALRLACQAGPGTVRGYRREDDLG